MAWTVGILGLIHDHVWQHLPELRARDDVRLAVAEPSGALRERVRREFEIDRIYADAAELLAREQPDAVLVFTDNAGAAPLVELAAAHGAAVMVEKPLADSLVNAERMRVATASAGVPLMVNWPTAWNPAIRYALDLAAGGAIGEIYRFNFRGGHVGPREFGCSAEFVDWLYDRERSGGGAYIDYCGYGASMARWLLGMPARAQATIGRLRKEDIAVDDNAVLVLRYPQAMAVIEATWSAAGPVPDGGPTIWGSTGALVVQRQKAQREGQAGSRGVVLHLTPDDPDGTVLEPPELPAGERTAVEYFLSRLADGRSIDGLVSLAVGRDTQEILEAGLQSAHEGRAVSLPLEG